jgi:hypothetical protein
VPTHGEQIAAPSWRDVVWQPLRLFAVGIAWCSPFLPLCFLGAPEWAPAHPRIAHLLMPLQKPLLLLSPLVVIAGIVLVARLPRCSPPRSRLVIALAALIPLLVLAGLLSSEPIVFMLAPGAAAVLLLAGATTTIRAFWRRARWLAVGWLCLWLALSVVFWLGGVQHDRDYGLGLVAVAAVVAWLVVALIVAVLASSWSAVPLAVRNTLSSADDHSESHRSYEADS